VKVTVIATGFQPESLPAVERRGSVTPVIRVQSPDDFFKREPEPDYLSEVEPPVAEQAPEPEPEPAMVAAAEPMLDLDDLETPAYLRQGRLLN
jgi:hypothetical protein